MTKILQQVLHQLVPGYWRYKAISLSTKFRVLATYIMRYSQTAVNTTAKLKADSGR